jgi:hypothetical protein
MLNPVGQLLLHRPLMAAGLVAQGRHGLGVRELDLEISRANRRSTRMEQLHPLCCAAHNRLDVRVTVPGVPDLGERHERQPVGLRSTGNNRLFVDEQKAPEDVGARGRPVRAAGRVDVEGAAPVRS